MKYAINNVIKTQNKKLQYLKSTEENKAQKII